VGFLTRIDRLKETAFRKAGFNGCIIFNAANMFYFLGFQGASALFVPADGAAMVYVYGVNYEQAKAEAKGFNVQLVREDENLLMKIALEAKKRSFSRLLIDALGVQSWQAFTKEFNAGGGTVEVNGSYFQRLRAVKDPCEVEFMRRAAEFTSRGMEAAAECLKAGVREYEAAAEIEYAMRRRGAGPTAFETIVASGKCSAFPHGGCTGREIRDGDLVVVDLGATYNYYCSDMTRTFVAGKPTDRQQKIYGAECS
jgi:Xaa-Pro aminopeptidase